MEYLEIHNYLLKLHDNNSYVEMSANDREKLVFSAHEQLKDEYDESKLTPRIVALQSLYMAEGGEEGFGRLKRQGVKTYAVKGVSVSFEAGDISPDVIKLLSPKTAMVGRFYQ